MACVTHLVSEPHLGSQGSHGAPRDQLVERADDNILLAAMTPIERAVYLPSSRVAGGSRRREGV